jgi:hypothetical protein
MRYTLLYPGDLLVEQVPARVVITYEIPVLEGHGDAQFRNRVNRAGRAI